MTDEYPDSFSPKSNNIKTPQDIAYWISDNATLATMMQYTLKQKPGMINLKGDKVYDKYLSSCILVHKPIAEISTRGVMVERGLIDFDEVDFGWIISESIKRETKWNSGLLLNLGKLFLFTPIAASVGYLISELSDPEEFINYSDIVEHTEYFLENTTPEDTVNLVTALYQTKAEIPIKLMDSENSLHEQIENILIDEINLLDFYNLNKNNYGIFEEISTNYQICHKTAYFAFYEAINEDYSYQDAILHTYVSIMSKQTEPNLYLQKGRIEAHKVSQKAREVIAEGSIFTQEGLKALDNLYKYVSKKYPDIYFRSIDDMTANVTFLAGLSGIKP